MKVKPKKKAVKGRAAGVYFEDLDSKLDMIIEVVKGSEEHNERRAANLERKIDETREDLTEQIRGIRMILEVHDKKLNQHEERIVTLEKSVHH